MRRTGWHALILLAVGTVVATGCGGTGLKAATSPTTAPTSGSSNTAASTSAGADTTAGATIPTLPASTTASPASTTASPASTTASPASTTIAPTTAPAPTATTTTPTATTTTPAATTPTATATTTTPAATTPPAATTTTPAATTTTPSASPTGPAGGPVPAGFGAESATFVSAYDGWVLGTAPCTTAPCTSIVRTTNGGQAWVGIPAPKDNLSTLSSSPNGVSEIRFADRLDGWVFGPDLWSTHDGGATWNQVQLPGPDPEVVDLEASAGRVEVIVGTDCLATNGCRDQLWQSPAGSDRFAAIPGVDLSGASFDVGDLSLHADIGYLVGRSTDASNGHEISLLWRTADGVHWVHAPTVCPGTLAITSVAAVDVNRAALLCSGNAATGNTTKELYATSDGGRTWVPEGTQAPLGGDGGTLSAATVSTLAIATSSGASDIYLSTNGGAGWQTVLSVDDGGAGWGDFGFRNASDGFAVHAPISRSGSDGLPGVGTLYRTTNGGVTWSLTTF